MIPKSNIANLKADSDIKVIHTDYDNQAGDTRQTQQQPAEPAISSNNNLAVASDNTSNNTSEPAKDLAVAIDNVFSASQLDLVIESNLSALISKLQAAIPDIRTEMITIHKALAKDPAQVTILTQEQQAAIFAGYSKLTGIELVAKAAAKKGSKQQVSLEMFE